VYVSIGATFVGFVVLGVFEQYLVHICTGILEEFVAGIEDDESDLTIAKDAQFVGFLHQTKLALRKGDLSVSFVVDSRDLDFLPPHLVLCSCGFGLGCRGDV